jgi:hypothetical protein
LHSRTLTGERRTAVVCNDALRHFHPPADGAAHAQASLGAV